jgi:hypothetical protein
LIWRDHKAQTQENLMQEERIRIPVVSLTTVITFEASAEAVLNR